jgi:phosphatidate phosphatase APP1
VLPAQDPRVFAGEVTLVDESGITVISDIDDTVKVTQVNNRQATLRNTFLLPFEPVPGLAEIYGNWGRQPGTQFWYVSASPWQLFPPLSEFVRSNGFPAGVFYLKNFRWKDESFFDLFGKPDEYKLKVIEPLLKRFPNRRFVLVGDSGERDPEAYAALARKFPQQIARILIRDVTREPAEAERYQRAFRDVPTGLWQIFREPGEIANAFP